MHYIIFDLEATCWEGNLVGRQQEIIEIGAIKLDHFGKETGRYQAFVRPLHHPYLSVYCKELTGISQEDVNSAHDFGRVGMEFIDWIEDSDGPFRLFSWGNKDLDLLHDACSDNNLDPDWLDDYLDLKEEYHHIKRLSKKIGLKKALVREDIEFEGDHHRALDDAVNLARLFVRYIDEWPH